MINDGIPRDHVELTPTSCSDGVSKIYLALNSQQMAESPEDRKTRGARIELLTTEIIKQAERVERAFCDQHCQDPSKCIGQNPEANPIMVFNELLVGAKLGEVQQRLQEADRLHNMPEDTSSCPYLLDPVNGPVAALIEDLERSGPLGYDADPIYTDIDPRSGERLVDVIDPQALKEFQEELEEGPEIVAKRPHHSRPRRKKSTHEIKSEDQLAFDLKKQLELDLS